MANNDWRSAVNVTIQENELNFMLSHIHIHNFVIVKSLSLDFAHGLHVLTGETGAGKSIWIDAIHIGLGGRTDATIIYPGETTCDITLCFSLENQPEAKQWLTERDLSSDHECIIRRIIDHQKPSRTTINDVPVTQQFIREFAEHVLCIHGQHQHQQLLKSDDQRKLLDRHANNEMLLSEIQLCYTEWKTIHHELDTLNAQVKTKSSDLALWCYQRDELLALQIESDEYETIFKRYQELHHTKQFASKLNEAFSLINGDTDLSAIDQVHQSLQRIHSIQSSDKKITHIHSLLQTASIHLAEARDALQVYCNNFDNSDAELAMIEKRLTVLQDIARKHHVDPTELEDVIQSLNHNIEHLAQSDQRIQSLEKKQQTVINAYQKIANKLTYIRDKTAKTLSADITSFMQQLGMQEGRFEIQLVPTDTAIHSYGNETIQFFVATNSGQVPHALGQIVSGGELSRLSLIIQLLIAQQKNTPTLIFDEVDAGIGGKTADMIGRLLRKLGEKTQVLCVTHLPQVAACGHHHFLAEKATHQEKTCTTITVLDDHQRIKELARMLSGAAITQKSMLHAKELLMSL